MRKLTHTEIVNRQRLRQQQPRIPLVVVLADIRSLYNVGAIFRTADAIGVEKLWLCGITGCPPSAQLGKIALGAEEHVAWEHAQDVLEPVRSYRQRGYHVVLLEQTDQGLDYAAFVPQGPVCLVLGNEIQGLDDRLVAEADMAIEIHMAGSKNSLNVAVAFGVVGYHIRQALHPC